MKSLDDRTIDDILQYIDENLLTTSNMQKYQNNNNNSSSNQLIIHQHLNDYIERLMSKRQGQNDLQKQRDTSIKKKFGQSIQLIFMNSDNNPSRTLKEVTYFILYHI